MSARSFSLHAEPQENGDVLRQEVQLDGLGLAINPRPDDVVLSVRRLLEALKYTAPKMSNKFPRCRSRTLYRKDLKSLGDRETSKNVFRKSGPVWGNIVSCNTEIDWQSTVRFSFTDK